MSTWNDKRLDELSARTDAGFQEVKAEVKDVRAELKEVRGEMKAGFTRVDDQLLRLSHILIIGGLGLITALIGVIASVVLPRILG